ncbi:hypothetical protein D3C83_33350 [compost metagenome]
MRRFRRQTHASTRKNSVKARATYHSRMFSSRFLRSSLPSSRGTNTWMRPMASVMAQSAISHRSSRAR